MRLLALTCLLGILVGCGESRGAGATGGTGGSESTGGKNTGGKSTSEGGETTGGSKAEAGTTGEGGREQGGANGVAGGGAGPLGGGGAAGMPMVSTGGQGMLSGVCEGAFLEPSHQILAGTKLPSNLAVTGDELELFFNNDEGISSYERASTGVLFPEQATPVAGLAGVCGDLIVGGMDVTLDGLHLYISCSDDNAGFVGPLRLATRADRQSPFTLSPTPLGTVGNSISISDDELTLFAVTEPGPNAYVLVHERDSLDVAFGPGELVQGLGGPVSYPELSPDGLNLFGVAGPDKDQLVVASRAAASGPFSAPTSTGLPAPAGSALHFGPTVSQTCRLYFLSFTPGGVIPSTIDLLGR